MPATRWFEGPWVPRPIPWQRRPSSLAYDVVHVLACFGCLRSCRYSRMVPVSVSRTGKAEWKGFRFDRWWLSGVRSATKRFGFSLVCTLGAGVGLGWVGLGFRLGMGVGLGGWLGTFGGAWMGGDGACVVKAMVSEICVRWLFALRTRWHR